MAKQLALPFHKIAERTEDHLIKTHEDCLICINGFHQHGDGWAVNYYAYPSQGGKATRARLAFVDEEGKCLSIIVC